MTSLFEQSRQRRLREAVLKERMARHQASRRLPVAGGHGLLMKERSTTAWKPATLLEELVPPGNFVMLLALVVAAMWLAGTMKSYDSCSAGGDVTDRTCIAINSPNVSCNTPECMAVPITLIIIAGWWFLLQLPGISKTAYSWAKGSDWKTLIVMLPIFGSALILFIYIISLIVDSGETRVTAEGIVNENEQSAWQAANALLMLTLVCLSISKCQDIAGNRFSPSLECYLRK